MEKVKCAFFREGRVVSATHCGALNELHCEGCRFRKTKEQLREEHDRAKQRIERVYGITFESFLDLKGYGHVKKICKEWGVV